MPGAWDSILVSHLLSHMHEQGAGWQVELQGLEPAPKGMLQAMAYCLWPRKDAVNIPKAPARQLRSLAACIFCPCSSPRYGLHCPDQPALVDTFYIDAIRDSLSDTKFKKNNLFEKQKDPIC